MKSIDNLREYALTAPSICSTTRAILVGYVDSIDTEHQKVLDEWKVEYGQMWLKGYSECHAELLEGNETLASDLEGCGWVRLPVDADGEPIHVGDAMENIICPSVHREVTGVGVECFYGWDDGNGRYSQFDANCYRHHHAPTVEDVLREFVERLDEIGSEDDCVGVDEQECRACIRRDIAAAYAEYAAKLRLAEGVDK